jgi:hypothetical protein
MVSSLACGVPYLQSLWMKGKVVLLGAQRFCSCLFGKSLKLL